MVVLLANLDLHRAKHVVGESDEYMNIWDCCTIPEASTMALFSTTTPYSNSLIVLLISNLSGHRASARSLVCCK